MCAYLSNAELTQILVGRGRLSTIMDADQIIVMRDGQVAESGRHADLLAQGGLYAEMWSRQQEAAAVEGAGSAPASRTGSRAASAADLQSVAADGEHRQQGSRLHR